VPADAVTASASGLDPDVSPANAALQARRIAAARGVSVAQVEQIIAAHTTGRVFGILGQPRVNVLEVNLGLDARLPVPPAAR
jgi:K+-transporting ATPase ATPase C chain